MPSRVRNPVFDELFEAALPAVLDGTHQRDEPPVDGGRWPVTVVARPPQHVRAALERLMRETLAHAGCGHFVTGRQDSVHLTIRALEPYREAATPTDPVVRRWCEAMGRAAGVTPPLRFAVTGVTLSRAGVMAQVETVDDEPWRFMDRLREELGDLAWFEDQWMRRNIWYATLVHFTGDIVDPCGLIDWVGDHRTIETLDFTLAEVELVRSRHVRRDPADPTSEQLMRPETWFTVPLSGTD